MKRLKEWLILYGQGMMMGIADLIPGVSGGTIAFICGLHPKLLRSLKTLKLSHLKNPRKIHWFTLSSIALGMLSTIAMGAHGIHLLLNHNIYQGLLRALFMGLVIGSIFYCLRQIAHFSLFKVLALGFGVLVSFATSYFCLTQMQEPVYDVPFEVQIHPTDLNKVHNYDAEKKLLKNVKWSHLKSMYQNRLLEPDALIFSHALDRFLRIESCLESRHSYPFYAKVAICGAVSIGAMILPGISGNQVMQIMGLYETIIEAISHWTQGVLKGSFFNASFWILLTLGVGILIGVALFSRLLIYFYQKHFQFTLSLLIGFMIGSLVNLWPFWNVGYHLIAHKDRYQLTLQRLSLKMPPLTSYHTGLALAMVILGIASIVMFERKLAFKRLEFSQEKTT